MMTRAWMRRMGPGALALGLMLVLVLAWTGGPAFGGKPSKPPPPPPPPVDTGTIYFNSAFGDASALYAMDPDGTDKTVLFGIESGSESRPVSEPSIETHWCSMHQKSERWFLRVSPTEDDTWYPNGLPCGELFAVCESGSAVQLTYAPDLEPANSLAEEYTVASYTRARPRWTEGDSRVTYLAKRWEEGEVVEWGLYAVEMDLDHIASQGTASPTHLPVSVDLNMIVDAEGNPTWHGGRINVTYDWSPDASEIVIRRTLSGYEGIWYANEASDWTLSRIRATGYMPEWSPDGSEILFVDTNIYRMDPDPASNPYGTATLVITAPASSNKVVYTLDGYRWSPNGTHLVYRLGKIKSTGPTFESDIYRATASGGDVTNLTGDTTSAVQVIGWR